SRDGAGVALRTLRQRRAKDGGGLRQGISGRRSVGSLGASGAGEGSARLLRLGASAVPLWLAAGPPWRLAERSAGLGAELESGGRGRCGGELPRTRVQARRRGQGCLLRAGGRARSRESQAAW